MIFSRKSWVTRLVAVLVLVCDLPGMTGLDRLIDTIQTARAQDPERTVYEIAPDPEISRLAEELGHSAPRLFEWVRREVAFEPYAGVQKGAAATLLSRSGNALDKALLLAALCDASNIRWRLVVGDVRLSMAEALSWLGLASQDQLAVLLAQSGIRWRQDDGVVLEEHPWIEVWVDYFPVRGAARDDVLTGPLVTETRDPEESWVALDPTVTFRDAPRAPSLAEALGAVSSALFEVIKRESEPVAGEEGVAVTNLPRETIVAAARRAGESLRDYLNLRRLTLDEWCGLRGDLRLAAREALPGNLPYEVLDHPTLVGGSDDPHSLASWLGSGARRYLTLRLRLGAHPVIPEKRVGLPRLGRAALTVRFEAENPAALAPWLNAEAVTLDPAEPVMLKALIELGGVEIGPAGPEFHNVPLGASLELDLVEEGRPVRTIPVVAGGHYEVAGVRTLSASEGKRRGDALNALLASVGSETGFLAGGLRQRILREHLSLAAQAVLLQSERFGRLGAAALGYLAPAAGLRAVAGIEPLVFDGQLTSATLVAHLAGPADVCVARVAQPSASADEARTAVALARDLALTGAMEALSGHDGHQSATRLLSLASGAGAVFRALARDTGPAPLTGKAPAAFEDEATARLRASALVLPGADLFGRRLAGRNADPAGWGWWELGTGGRGAAGREDLALRQAWVRLPDTLCPLDMLLDGARPRYAALLHRAAGYAENAAGVTALLEPGVTGAVGILYDWLDSSQTGVPHPAGVPAAAIALHGVAEHFGRPRMEAVEAAPLYVSDARTFVTSATLSAPVSVVRFTLEDDRRTTRGEKQRTDSAVRFYAVDWPGLDLEDGEYTVAARGEAGGVSSDVMRAPFIVDNTPPVAVLAGTTGSVAGTFTLQGRVSDRNLSAWVVKGRPAGSSGWVTLNTGTSDVSLTAPLAAADTRALGWTGEADFRLEALDRAGNESASEIRVTLGNDFAAPSVSFTRADGRPLVDGEVLQDTVAFRLSAEELPPGAAKGLRSLRFRLESLDFPDKAPVELFAKTGFAGADLQSFTAAPVTLDTHAVPRDLYDERWRLVAEAVDLANNRATTSVENLTIGNLLFDFQVGPRTLRALMDRAGLTATFTNNVAWTLKILNEWGGTEKHVAQGTDDGFYAWWHGDDDAGRPSEIGSYSAALFYDGREVKIPMRIVDWRPPHFPRVRRLQTFHEENGTGPPGADSGELPPPASPEVSGGALPEFVITEGHPWLRITAQVPATMRPFLDGQGPPEPWTSHFPQDAFWTVDVKASAAFPSADDIEAGRVGRAEMALHRDNWRIVRWGNGWPSDGAADGQVEAWLDTRGMASGYYDVRIWVTDTGWVAQHYVLRLKVTRTSSGSPDSPVGAMTLSATDMTVPFNGYPVSITRSCSSADTFAPGPLGYGWKLGAISLQIEKNRPGADESMEAHIRLPDGRMFFFANNPPEGTGATALTQNAWARNGEFIQRPFGMRLYLPGASDVWHQDVYTIQPQNLPPLAPGAPGRTAEVRYRNLYGPGAVAYLQTEDKTWLIFEWGSGDLLEIIRPDGQTVTFQKSDEANILIRDSSNRAIRVARDPDPSKGRRILRLTDPTGHQVEYSYDQYGNLSAVRDRSGRRRFYLYDTPEVKKLFPGRDDLTGLNVHYLVDVRVDDDLSEGHRTPRFEGDSVPSSATPLDPNSFLSRQDWPGDRSIMKVEYGDDGLVKALETYSGSVEMDHAPGAETVRNGLTGTESKVDYDDLKRVTRVVDFWKHETRYGYGQSGSIQGVLTEEIDALGHRTTYGYPAIPGQEYDSFAEMFEAYLRTKLLSDLSQPGYLTGAQAQPSEIVQDAGGLGVVTTVNYNLAPGSPSAFQPTGFTAPGGSSGVLTYDDGTGAGGDGTGKLKEVAVYGADGSPGSRTVNEYYTAADGPTLAGRLKSVTAFSGPSDAAGTSTSYSYEFLPAGDTFLEKHVIRNGATGLATTSVYDASGRLVSSTDSRGRTATSTADGEGRVTVARDEDGNTVYSYYDVLGLKVLERFTKAPFPGQGTVINIWTSYRYDEGGRPTEVVRRRDDGTTLSASRTEYREDATGRTETTWDLVSGGGHRSVYDGGGRLVRGETLDALGQVTDAVSYACDALGRVVREETFRGVTRTYEYDALGQLTASTVQGAGSTLLTRNGYDEAGRLHWTWSAATGYQTFEYDAFDRRVRTWVAASGRGATDGPFTSIRYDVHGRQELVTDEEGISTRYAYDPVTGRMTDTWLGWKSEAEPGLRFRFEYDVHGNTTRIIDPLSHDRVKVYDAQGRLWREYGHLSDQSTSPLGLRRQVTQYTYYPDGRVRTKEEGTAADTHTAQITRTTTYTYDPVTGRLLQETAGDGAKTVHHYLPDGRRRRVESWGPGGVLEHWREFTYDPRTGRVASQSSPEGRIEYEYGRYGDLGVIRVAGTGEETRYTWDALGRLASVSGTVTGGAVTYTYDPATGRRKSLLRPNGVETVWTWDARGHVDTIVHQRGQTVLLGLDYDRDARGLITTTTETRQEEDPGTVVWTYTYDAARRLTSATATGTHPAAYSYTYDPASNRTSQTANGVTTTYTYNSLGQLVTERTAGTEKTYTWDTYGNLWQETEGETLQREYTWDAKNRLRSVRLLQPEERTIAFAYDDEDTRVRRTDSLSNSTNAKETHYLTDYSNPSGHSQVLKETNGAGQVERAYAWGGEGLLAQRETAENNYCSYVQTDHLNSLRLLTDNVGVPTSGSGISYEPFGKLLRGVGRLSSYQFTGQCSDALVGLQYHRGRWLSSAEATWTSADPLWDWPDNFGSVYGYAGRDPVNRRDVTGRFAEGLGGIVGGDVCCRRGVSGATVSRGRSPFWADRHIQQCGYYACCCIF